ncbi:MAG: tetratricopeptide repeat protein [Pseudomonadota bacterium]
MRISLKILPMTVLLYLAAITNVSAAVDIEAALAEFENGRAEQAIAMLTPHAEGYEVQLALAKIYETIDLKEAGNWIEKAVAAQPDSAEVQYQLGVIRGAQAQNATFSALRLAKQSRKAFERAIEIAPESPIYVRGLIGFHLTAPSIAGGDLGVAQRWAERLESLDPVQGLLAQANIARAQKRYEDAIQILEKGLATYERNPLLAFNAGLLYQEQQNLDAAFVLFEQASQDADQENRITAFASLYQVGRIAAVSGTHTERGIEALTTYLEAAPAHEDLVPKPWAQFRLALLYDRDGRRAEAQTIYEQLKDTEDGRLRKEVRKKI